MSNKMGPSVAVVAARRSNFSSAYLVVCFNF